MLISVVDTSVARGGFVGVTSLECNVRFFYVRAGSPEHAMSAEFAFVAAALAVSPVPTGVVWEYAGSTAPDGWLLCDGSAVSRTTYADLYAVIGTVFGAGDGSTTFNLPDRRDRFGQGASATDALGTTGGVKMQTDYPQHSHYEANSNGPAYVNTGSGSSRTGISAPTITSATRISTDNSGTAGGVDQRPPFVAMNYIIKT
jgi:microcystin-dependent protein